ncbi:MAG: hypothetical protein WAK17_17520 [Candidatus Nitrosopolaris sp.]
MTLTLLRAAKGTDANIVITNDNERRKRYLLLALILTVKLRKLIYNITATMGY